MKKILLSLIMAAFTLYTTAQSFEEYFNGNTLRLDYVFAGDRNSQALYVDQLSETPGWYGRKHNLDRLPLEGNGQITLRDARSGKVIYRHSFSTLFQEWLATEESKSTPKSFENVFLVPFPKDSALVTVDLFDYHQKVFATMTHKVRPDDILIRKISRPVNPYSVLHAAKDTSNCIHIAFVAEGYTEGEMETFVADARTAMDAIFAHEPFKSMRDRFNVVAVKAVSAESGTSSPATGEWKNTALGSHFDTFYSSRYLTTLRLKTLHDVLAGTPYEHIIVLVNTDQYGGGGILNSYNLAMTHHPKFRPVVVHEFGHSFAGLADEYAYDFEDIPMYPHDVEPWEPNITTKVDFRNKWENLIGTDSQAGFYEGAGYSLKGVYRAYPDCRMRTNENPEFCKACRQALVRLINFYTE